LKPEHRAWIKLKVKRRLEGPGQFTFDKPLDAALDRVWNDPAWENAPCLAGFANKEESINLICLAFSCTA